MAIVAVCGLVAASCGGSDDPETGSPDGAESTETTDEDALGTGGMQLIGFTQEA